MTRSGAQHHNKNNNNNKNAHSNAESHEEADVFGFTEKLRQTPDSVVIRSLRRRLWQAFEKEDRAAALRCYQATRSDWEEIMLEEQQRLLLLRKQQEQAQQHHQHGKKALRGMFQRSTSKKQSGDQSSLSWTGVPKGTNKVQALTLDGDDGDPLLPKYMNPSEPFQPDDFKDPHASYEDEPNDDELIRKERRLSSSRKHRSVRQAFSLRPFRRGSSTTTIASAGLTGSHSGEESLTEQQQQHEAALEEGGATTTNTSTTTTTPLHEAARLGHAPLLGRMLAHAEADCNVRNGAGRTVLHCAAGGWTEQEQRAARCYDAHSGSSSSSDEATTITMLGIRAPQPPETAETEETTAVGERKRSGSVVVSKAARAMGRLFRDSLAGSKQHQEQTLEDNNKTIASCDNAMDENEKKQLDLERMKAVATVLAWSQPSISSSGSLQQQPNDGSVSQGVSTNVVDLVMGRTALHYAAELGRGEVCEAILEAFFGTMLTVIDSHGRTPCELAANRGADKLAASLEARALLYVDPYGTDEELLEAVIASESGGLVPPFCWFETLNMDSVRLKRNHRISQTLEKMQQIAETQQYRQTTQQAIREHARQIVDREDTVDQKPASENIAFAGIDLDAADEDGDMFYDAPSTKETTAAEYDSSNFEPRLHEGHVERFLKAYQFDVKKALEAFCEDPVKALAGANVVLPQHVGAVDHQSGDRTCLICCEEFEEGSEQWNDLSGCSHGFCSGCLREYISECATTKSTGLVVPCPHHECESLLSPLEIAGLALSESTSQKLLDTANEQFVADSHDFRFCPHPGCCAAVKYHEPAFAKASKKDTSAIITLAGAVCTTIHDEMKDFNADAEDSGLQDYQQRPAAVTYEGVRDPRYYNLMSSEEPRKAHRFCFQCGEPWIHWPIPCERLTEWKDAVAKQIGDVDDGFDGDLSGNENFNDVAQKLWMKANTRPCPKCKAPIQKNEGCNHMICSNPLCKHEFCWICRKNWKMHNSETGGFFRCNRWVEEAEHDAYDVDEKISAEVTVAALNFAEDMGDPRTMEVVYGTAMHETRAAKKKSREMARFLHHYRRWHAHAESAALEGEMGDTVCSRLAPVVREVIDISGSEYVFGGKGLSFIHAAFSELLECRSLLQYSYAFSFFRYKSTSSSYKYKLMRRRASEKLTFEQTQSELELMTEQISDVVARSHIRATQTQITFLTAVASGKRKEFSNVMINILLQERKEEMSEQKKAVRPERSDERSRATFLSGGNLLDNIVSGDTTPSQSESEASGFDEAVRESLEGYLAAVSAASGLLDYTSDDDEADSDWACGACTYVNAGGRQCEMCGTPR